MSPLWQPTLEGALLSARPLEAADFEALLAAAADPLIWEQHPEPDRWQRDVFLRYFDGGLKSRGALLVTDRRTRAIIGSSRFCGHDPEQRTVEVGYTFLTRTCWGGAFNRELKQLMLTHAFQHVDTVSFVVGQNNLRSQRALLKLGAWQARTDGDRLVFLIDRATAQARGVVARGA